MGTPPVEPGEVVCRQAGPGGTPIYFDPNRSPPLHHTLFLPGPHDTDGLSVVRAQYRTDRWAACRVERPDVRYNLVRLKVADLQAAASQHGMEPFPATPTPDTLDLQFGEPWAHAVLSQINRTEYDGDAIRKKQIKSWAKAVADQVELHAIVGPFDPPDEETPYRP